MVEIEMNDEAAAAMMMTVYVGALTIVSLYGLSVGWYHTLWVWALPLLTGFPETEKCSDMDQQNAATRR